MANPTYTYDISGSPLTGTLATLPRPPRWGRVLGIDEKNIVHETNRGVLWVYRLFERTIREYTFRFPESELAAFALLHTRVEGQLNPFIWSYESDTLIVRKEAGFHPVSLGAYRDGLVLAHWYDYTLKLTTETAGLTILA